ncbi:MAG: alpha/beta fold hydrolase [Atopobiaceae bacterium]|nr:alpha/beta fold hydrolase [Atopobiaceae bacterium]
MSSPRDDMPYTCIEMPCRHGEQRIYGKLFVPKAKGPFMGVVCSHGFNGTHASPERYARRFAAAGFAAYAFDFPGGSEESRSDGSMLEHSLATEADALCSVLKFFGALDLVDETRVFLEGHSQGGIVSALVAGRRPQDVQGLCLLYPAFMIPDMVRDAFGDPDEIPAIFEQLGATIGAPYARDVWDLDPYVQACGYDGPVLMFHGDHDKIVPRSCIERALDAYADAELVTLPEEGHGFGPDGVEQAASRMIAFMRAHAS